jgi:predicted SAM-dependent methyltransferase
MKIVTLGNLIYEADKDDEVIKSNFARFNFKEESVDLIVCTNLTELRNNEVIPFLGKAKRALKADGVLVIQVPSAEYAAKKLFLNEITPEILYMLYGGGDQPYHTCYTMKMLRALIDTQGFITFSAMDDIIQMTSEQNVVQIPVHTLRARKAA